MITITDIGAQKVGEFLAQQQANSSVDGLRVGVKGGGADGVPAQPFVITKATTQSG